MKKAVVLLLLVLLVSASFLKGQQPSQGHKELPEQYWTDIVTEQPEGYVVDANGDVHIHSAEGLAWLSVLSNGLHGQEADNFDGKTIFLEEDIDLAGFLWHPIATTIWDGSQNNSFYFEGVFYGKGHVIDNMVLVNATDILHFGLFGNIVHGEIRYLVLKNSRVDLGSDLCGGVLAYSIEDNSFISSCIVHCLHFRACSGGMFQDIDPGSFVVNSMIHYNYKYETTGGCGISYENKGNIINCASIIDTLRWSMNGECSGLVAFNDGMIKNSYSYWGELLDYPGYSDYTPRNGVTRNNDGGVVKNCYYNRMPEEYLFDDEPGYGGVFQDVSSFDMYLASWWLTNPVHVGTSLAWAFELVDALNYWIDNQSNSDDYRKWVVEHFGYNHGLPYFRRLLPEQYWTDIVTEQPEGYVVDANGDVHIHSAEGLAWLSVLSNGFHGQEADNFEGKTITLEAEVDMSRAIWTSICANESSFKGSFNGKEYVINGLQMTKTNGSRTGFFGSLSNAALSNIVIRNGYFDGIGYGMGFLASQATKCLIDHCFVECEMHGGECAPFVFSNIGSTITNSMVYSPFMRNEVDYWAWGGIFVAENRQYNGDLTLPQIINCAAVIKYMNWSEQCGFVGEYNHGLIENCYAYIDELLDCPGWAPGNPPRNGITRDNSGEIINCYYNSPLRIRDVYEGTLVEIPLIDVPCGNNTGTMQDAISFDRDVSGSWRLTHPISFNLGSGTVSTDVLLDALNNKLNELNNGNLLDWCDTVTGFDNQQLPVFCGIDIVEINEHKTDDNQVVLFPNPSDGNIRIEGVEVVEFQVFNSLGQLVKAYNNTNEIFLDNLPNGLYLIRIIDHKGDLITKKILVK